ncbi:MAG: flagellar hook-basal body complex protein FliE [Spirochaetes bacterium]|nr:flagellar hook-basal body complex protein FliE [Spirochaetota bacterium]
MKIFSNFDTVGDLVQLRKTNSKHFGIQQKIIENDNVPDSFGKVLNSALKKVNEMQNTSDNLTQKMITSPNEVNIHDVMIGVQKAQFSLNFTKAIRDRVLRAYQDIMSMR